MSDTMPPDPTPAPGPTGPGLHRTITGEGPSLVLAHGFTQTGRVWGTMDIDLASDHRVVAVDLPGHGGSAGVAADLVDGAELLGRAGGRGAYLGYSMGARVCLHLALVHPELVDSLVVISGTAGIEDTEERGRRRASDEALADQLDPPSPGHAVPVEVFVRQWMDNPMFAGIGPQAGGLDHRLANTGPGLASSLRLAGTGTQEPLWDRLGQLSMPVLIVTGELDAKFTALGRRMTEAIGPSATHVVVADAGHAPQLQQPRVVAAEVRRHLATARPR